MAALDVAMRFVSAINAHDVVGLAALMTDDHRFVDSLGTAFDGRDTMRTGWDHYFRMVPDYTIQIEESFPQGDVVVLLGTARGTYSADGSLRTENGWQTPAAWRVVVRGDRIVEWRVYADNEPIRQRMAAETVRV